MDELDKEILLEVSIGFGIAALMIIIIVFAILHIVVPMSNTVEENNCIVEKQLGKLTQMKEIDLPFIIPNKKRCYTFSAISGQWMYYKNQR